MVGRIPRERQKVHWYFVSISGPKAWHCYRKNANKVNHQRTSYFLPKKNETTTSYSRHCNGKVKDAREGLTCKLRATPGAGRLWSHGAKYTVPPISGYRIIKGMLLLYMTLLVKSLVNPFLASVFCSKIQRDPSITSCKRLSWTPWLITWKKPHFPGACPIFCTLLVTGGTCI